ncbi:MazG-like family protein [Paucilactobacillus sp. N302-9]
MSQESAYIQDKANPDKQMIKLVEEVGELSAAYNKDKDFEFSDSIGDIIVVLTILCQQKGVNIQQCMELALSQINGRKGKIIDGVFVKQADLNE